MTGAGHKLYPCNFVWKLTPMNMFGCLAANINLTWQKEIVVATLSIVSGQWRDKLAELSYTWLP